MYRVKILLDSISPTGKRITTFELTYPRIIHCEFMTHRMLSRNAASSRAIPFKRMLESVLENPFIPESFPVNGKGMQPQAYYEQGSENYTRAKRIWLSARDAAVSNAKKLVGQDYCDLLDSGNDFVTDTPVYLNIHKQIANRLLEPFLWYTCIVTATEWDNFFKLRTHPDAQSEIKKIADLMYEVYHCYEQGGVGIDQDLAENSTWSGVEPKQLKDGEWHCPLVSTEDDQAIYSYLFNHGIDGDSKGVWKSKYTELRKMISVARCARVSYLTHDGKRDIEKDLELFERLRTSGHWSPFEHVAQPFYNVLESHPVQYQDLPSGNFKGWSQYRKEFKDENCGYFRK